MRRAHFILIFLLIANPAFAKDLIPVSHDFAILRIYDNGLKPKSVCMQDKTTPDCAIESFLKCSHLLYKGGCNNQNELIFDNNTQEPSIDDLTVSVYKTLYSRPVTQEDIDDNKKTSIYQNGLWEIGDILLFIATQQCKPSKHCFDTLKNKKAPEQLAKCPPVQCDAGIKTYANGKHAPDLYILRKEKDSKWAVIDYIMRVEFDESTPDMIPQNIFQEGQSQMPW